MSRFRLKKLNLSTDVPWLKEGSTYEGEFVAMKHHMVSLRSPDGKHSVEVPISWLEELS